MTSSQYFEHNPSVESDQRELLVALPDTSFKLRTDRGTFSHGSLDTGTRLLLMEAPAPAATGHLLDIGCGAGPIALTLARRSPGATVWAVEVNERARRLCAENAAMNGIGNIRVCDPESVPAELRFATIWSNPPIRIGKAPLHDLLQHWLPRLEPEGVAILVVQKHLGADSLARWIETELEREVDRLVSRSGYRLLRIRLRRT